MKWLNGLGPGGWSLAVLAICFVAVTLAACGNDATITERDHAPAEAINFPDHFSSVATKCNHGNRIYESDHGSGSSASSVAVVPHDESCRP